jgi:hypothetical protein
MRFKQAIWIVGGCLAATTIIAAALPLLLARSSNCGGNSAALSNCKKILIYAEMFGVTNSFLPDANLMGAAERDQFLALAMNHWTHEVQYWVQTNAVPFRSCTQVVVFCEQAFDNVPQPTLFNLYKRTPAHAVGFADGSTRLISPVDFLQVNKEGFAPLSALKPVYQP